MALSRSAFKDKVRGHLKGGIIEFYKARLAEKNGFTRWTGHWKNEADRLVGREFAALLTDPIRGFKDRQKAVEQVTQEMGNDDDKFQRYATHVVKRDFQITGRLRKQLEPQDRAAFYGWVSTTMKEILN